jgi:AAA15 family ATPase/GTPase
MSILVSVRNNSFELRIFMKKRLGEISCQVADKIICFDFKLFSIMNFDNFRLRSNPFSTCNWQAGVIDYIFDAGVDCRVILERLLAAGGIGQIVGEHGSGKSALLETFAKFLQKYGLNVQKTTLNSSQKNLHQDFLLSLQKINSDTIHILDGYEQLSLVSRIGLRRIERHKSNGLIFTTHKRAIYIPIIYRTTAKPEIFQALVQNMIKNTNFKIDQTQIIQIIKNSNGNFRNGFFKLYDLFEEQDR